MDEGVSIQAQKRRILEYVRYKKLNLANDDIIIEEGVSGGIPLWDREAHHVGGSAGRQLLLGAHLRMGRGRGVNRERARVADVGHVADELERVDESGTRLARESYRNHTGQYPQGKNIQKKYTLKACDTIHLTHQTKFGLLKRKTFIISLFNVTQTFFFCYFICFF